MDKQVQETYQLFKSDFCGYCHRVRHFLDTNGIEVELRDTLRDAGAYNELIQGGGRGTVPCLRIERDGAVEWMYESVDIMQYLGARFTP